MLKDPLEGILKIPVERSDLVPEAPKSESVRYPDLLKSLN